MMKLQLYIRSFFAIVILMGILFSCKEDPEVPTNNNNDERVYDPTFVTITSPENLPPLEVPEDNPMTQEGIDLGRKLFYEPLLSGDNTMACAACHNQQLAFTDNGNRFSTGIDGIEGDRNSMALFNLSYHASFFWDGRAATLEEQILEPVPNPIEMHEQWPDAVADLQSHPEYPDDFFYAFGTDSITPELVSKAMAQFLRTIFSADTKYDKQYTDFVAGTPMEFTEEEWLGYELFNRDMQIGAPVGSEGRGADCFHCHGEPLFMSTDAQGQFRNNGLQDAPTITDFNDPGRGGVTGNTADYGLFKAPSLRNIELTAPYMHDGRFETLEEVVAFYDTGVHQNTVNIDPLMQKGRINGDLGLTQDERDAIVAFLKTLTDPALATNPDFSDPHN